MLLENQGREESSRDDGSNNVMYSMQIKGSRFKKVAEMSINTERRTDKQTSEEELYNSVGYKNNIIDARSCSICHAVWETAGTRTEKISEVMI